MKSAHKIIASLSLLLLPATAFGGTDSTVCHAIEYPDHFVAVCTGDEQAVSAPAGSQTPHNQGIQTAPVGTNPTRINKTTVAGGIIASPTAAADNQPAARVNNIIASAGRGIHRFHRPAKADMDAAIAERRAMILAARQNSASEPATTRPEPDMDISAPIQTGTE